MSVSGLKLPTKSEAEARADAARKDRQGWFEYHDYILRNKIGKSVAYCPSKSDRDQILLMSRSWDAMKAALATAHDVLNDLAPSDTVCGALNEICEALKLAGRT